MIDRAGPSWTPGRLAALLVAFAAALALIAAGQVLSPGRWIAAAFHPDSDRMAEIVFAYATVPRVAAALLGGAALGLGGALFQISLGNPLAVPETLGVSAGAQLALAAVTVWAPSWLALGRGPIAFAGGCLAVAAAIGVAWRGSLRPALLLPAGLATAFYLSALATVLQLFHTHDLSEIAVWSGGSLSLQDWSPVTGLAAACLPAAVVVAVLSRPLALLDLGEATGRTLGLPVTTYRFAALALGVALTAAVTGAFGPLGFIGLGAPVLARAAGARRPAARLAWSALLGAALLWLADGAVSLAAPVTNDALATGSATSLVGTPVLVWLLARTRLPAALGSEGFPGAARGHLGAMLLALAAALVVVLALGILTGRGQGGWTLDLGPALVRVLPWRLPRTAAAASAGALLAWSGTLLQRVTANPLASPDMLGLGAGAALGLMAASLFGLDPYASTLAAASGALAVGLALLLSMLRGGIEPGRLVVVGLSLAGCAEAIIGAFAATGDPRATSLMAWMAGSTSSATARSATAAWATVAALILPMALLARPLDVLGLGRAPSGALGLPFGKACLAACLVATLAAAAGTLVVGPFSFVGLVAPQIAGRLGFGRALTQAAGAALAGALLMAFSDVVGRVIDFPWQTPAGIVSALIGAPLMLILYGGRRR